MRWSGAAAGGAVAKKLLVVEDNAATRDMLGDVLRRAGYDVVFAADGRQALDSLRAGPPDLILLDMLLPVLDGWHFLEELNRLQPDPAVRVVVVTGTDAVGREWTESHGCAGFLRKPIEPAPLLAEIERCLA